MSVLVKFVVAFTWLMLKIKLSILNHSNKNEHANCPTGLSFLVYSALDNR